MQTLPATTALLYSELQQQCLSALPSERGVSYYTKTVSGRDYWYAELVVGSTKRQMSLGPDTADLRRRIASHRNEVAADRENARERQRLVAMLAKGGATVPSFEEARVLEVLERSGVFQAGGVLVGSHAFMAYANILGVMWPSAAQQTQDMDVAAERIAVGITPTVRAVQDMLADTGFEFLAVPALDRKSPSTSYRIRGREFHVDLITPMQGPDRSSPVLLRQFRSYATPMRFLDYVIESPEPAVVIAGQGILINVPNPARFALHKLVVAERRRTSEQNKARKDRSQAGQLLEVLLRERQGDLLLALDAAKTMPKKFQTTLVAAIDRLGTPIRLALDDLGASALTPAS